MSSPSEHAQTECPNSARHLQSAVEQINETVLITEGTPIEEPGPKITYVNSAFTKMTGYSSEEVLGKTPRILQGPATESWVLDRLRHRLKQQKSFEGEVINYRKDGTPFINHLSIAPVRNEEGVVTDWVSVQRDVTEKRNVGMRLLKAQEEERARISRSIHDELGGQLASLQMLTKRIEDRLPDDLPEVASLLLEVQQQIDGLSGTVRRLTDASSSRVLNDFGLTEALSQLTNEFAEERGLDVEMHNEISSGERLSPLLEHVLFRILREALSNVASHTGTDFVQLLLNKTDQELRVHVITHGEGFRAPEEHHDVPEYGFSAMFERINRLNGRFSINSQAEEGTRLTITLPLALFSLQEAQETRTE